MHQSTRQKEERACFEFHNLITDDTDLIFESEEVDLEPYVALRIGVHSANYY